MTRTYFVFILILILLFSVLNAGFEKRHNDKSIFEEKKVKNTIRTATMIDEIARLITDISVVA